MLSQRDLELISEFVLDLSGDDMESYASISSQLNSLAAEHEIEEPISETAFLSVLLKLLLLCLK